MTLYRKYRPQTFAEVAGQPQVTDIVSRAIAAGQPAHAYLFAGPRGTGKTSVARIIAKSLNCLQRSADSAEPCNQCEHCQAIAKGAFLDVVELDAASNRGIDEIRQLKEQVALAPSMGRYKVYILDEAHMLTDAAFNALLKTLEEPPANVVFILCTTEAHKIPITIASRCQRLTFSRANTAQLVEQLQAIAKAEKLEIKEDALLLLANLADGGYRDAEMLLEQAMAMAPTSKTSIDRKYLEDKLGLASQQVVDDLVVDIAQANNDQLIARVEDFVGRGGNIRQLVDALLDQARQLLLIPALEPADIADPDRHAHLVELSQQLGQAQLLRVIQALLDARQQLQHFQGHHQALALETAMLEALQKPTEPIVAASTAPNNSSTTKTASVAPDANPPVGGPGNRTSKRSDGQVASISPHQASKDVPPAQDAASPSQSTEQSSQPETQDLPTGQAGPKPETNPPVDKLEAVPSQDLQDLWAKILTSVRPKSRSVEAILRDCLPLSFDGTILVLQFWYVFHKNRLDIDKNRRLVEDAAAEVTGQTIKVQTQLGDKSERPKKKPMSTEDIHNVSDIQAPEDENIVDAALEIFGGEIVE